MPRFMKVTNMHVGLKYELIEYASAIINTIAQHAPNNSKNKIIPKKDISLAKLIDIVKECQEAANEINSSQAEYMILVSAQLWDNTINILKVKTGYTASDAVYVIEEE